jgi:hypothetical protein
VQDAAWHLVLTSTWQTEFRHTFRDPLMPNKSTVSRTVNCFGHTGTLHLAASNMNAWITHLMRCEFPAPNVTSYVSWFQCNFFLWNITRNRNGLRDFAIILYTQSINTETIVLNTQTYSLLTTATWQKLPHGTTVFPYRLSVNVLITALFQ